MQMQGETRPQVEIKPKGGIIDRLIPGPMLRRERRIIAGVLIFLAGALVFISYFFPFWYFTLHAPQYPQGLHVKLYLHKVEGDVSEIDILNHYIGMKKMEEAAKFERKVAFWGILLLSLGMLGFIFSSRKTMIIFTILPVLFLIVFLGDLFFWLYKYGHELDPHAPIKIAPFTPAIIGKGKVGQFETFAKFGPGFFFVLAAFALSLVALFLRVGVCNACPARERCGLICQYAPKWKASEEEYKKADIIPRQ